ncbi:hypothetical protein CRUP_018523, partial [Coryphaenoides rupestris]
MEEVLVKAKKEKPAFIPYYVSACRELPGKFLLGYQPRGKPRVEFVTITPEGFRDHSEQQQQDADPGVYLTRAVSALPPNMTSQMFNAIAAVTGQGQNPNATPAQWASSQYAYSGGGGSSTGGGGSSSAYHPVTTPLMTPSYSYATPSQLQSAGTPQYPSGTPQSSHGGRPSSSTPNSSTSTSSSRHRTPQLQA